MKIILEKSSFIKKHCGKNEKGKQQNSLIIITDSADT